MALYDYVCPNGHIQLDVIRRVADRDAPSQCEECKEETTRMISVPATPVLNPGRPVKRAKTPY